MLNVSGGGLVKLGTCRSLHSKSSTLLCLFASLLCSMLAGGSDVQYLAPATNQPKALQYMICQAVCMEGIWQDLKLYPKALKGEILSQSGYPRKCASPHLSEPSF